MHININFLEQPGDQDFLWRYIQPNHVDSFLKGEVYFPSLMDFQDRHEALSPLHATLYKFLTINANQQFDLQKPLNEQNPESITGTIMMWLALEELEKKLNSLGLLNNGEQAQDILEKYLGNPKNLHGPHINLLSQFHSSCWFRSGQIESALMWTSYSAPGGIAVRIKYDQFKKHLVDYIKASERLDGIQQIWAGLIKYIDHDGDFETWNQDIIKGIPLAMFKQIHFNQESEFRILLERDLVANANDFQRIHPVFKNLDEYTIILHPSSKNSDFLRLQGRVKKGNKIRLQFSKIKFKGNS